jgi:hypothetical protein
MPSAARIRAARSIVALWYSLRSSRDTCDTVAQQGMDSKVMIKIFGHVDLRLIIFTYYSQNDDDLLLKEAEKIDFGL